MEEDTTVCCDGTDHWTCHEDGTETWEGPCPEAGTWAETEEVT